MKKIISIVLVIAALGLGYLGIQTLQSSQTSLEIGDLEISAGDKQEKTTGYVYLGLAVVSLVVGGSMINQSKS